VFICVRCDRATLCHDCCAALKSRRCCINAHVNFLKIRNMHEKCARQLAQSSKVFAQAHMDLGKKKTTNMIQSKLFYKYSFNFIITLTTAGLSHRFLQGQTDHLSKQKMDNISARPFQF